MSGTTAIILTDPYNDFLPPEGKMYGMIAESLKATNTVEHIQELVTAARSHKLPIYYGFYQQYHPGQYDGWKHMTETHVGTKNGKVFEEGSWGAKIYEGLEPQLSNGDVVVFEALE